MLIMIRGLDEIGKDYCRGFPKRGISGPPPRPSIREFRAKSGNGRASCHCLRSGSKILRPVRLCSVSNAPVSWPDCRPHFHNGKTAATTIRRSARYRYDRSRHPGCAACSPGVTPSSESKRGPIEIESAPVHLRPRGRAWHTFSEGRAVRD
jgi:hypothetical protein